MASAAGSRHCGLRSLPRSIARSSPRYLKPDVQEIIGPGETARTVPWDELTPEQRRFQATKMAIHAAMVDRMDQEIGRVLEQVRSMGVWDNTLIMFLSDNGADATLLVRGDGHDQSASPGSAATFICVLARAGRVRPIAPFRRHKIWVQEGGISTPCIIQWPKTIPPGGQLAAHAPAHVIAPCPHVPGVGPVSSRPMNGTIKPRPPLSGKSLVPIFDRDADIPRECLYWQHEGNAALRVGDWKLVCESENNGTWELYDLKHDRIESHDLSSQVPGKGGRKCRRNGKT